MTNVASDLTLLGDVDMVSGKTLTIPSGATLEVAAGGTLNAPRLRHMPIDLDEFKPNTGAPPTAAEVVSNVTTKVLLFDATAEKAHLSLKTPADLNAAFDANLILHIALVEQETDLDELDMTFDYIIPEIDTTAKGLTRAKTTVTAQTIIATPVREIGDVYQVNFLLEQDDADNPFAITSVAINGDIFMTNIGEVAKIHLFGAQLTYTADA